MSILIDDDTRVIVQGITGRQGRLHTEQMIIYGTQVVAGVAPGKGGEWAVGKPVFDTVSAAVEATEANTSVIFVPPPHATDAIYEAVSAGIRLIVCITEGIPVQDMMQVNDYVRRQNCRLIGPNCPGVLVPEQAKIGIIPNDIATAGNVGVVSRSGTLSYEVIHALTRAGIGQSTCIGIGGDPIIGTRMVDVLEMFEADPQTVAIALLGEIGGRAELAAAEYIRNNMTKRVVAFVAGKSAPEGRRMGHAGAIVAGRDGTAAVKTEALAAAGAVIAEHPEQIPDLIKS